MLVILVILAIGGCLLLKLPKEPIKPKRPIYTGGVKSCSHRLNPPPSMATISERKKLEKIK
jgi:hypothetical protein